MVVGKRRSLADVEYYGRKQAQESSGQSCWTGSYTHQRCCQRQDPSCFDEVYTQDRCCQEQPNRSATWWGGSTVLSLSHFVLFNIRDGMSCLSSPTFQREACCSSPQGLHLGYNCWDSVFTREVCCGHASGLSERAQLSRTSCWSGAFNYEICCKERETGNYLGCWDGGGIYSFENCCYQDDSLSPLSGQSTGNLSSLYRAALRGNCQRDGHASDHCARLWLAALNGVGSLTHSEVMRIAELVVQHWRNGQLLQQVSEASPTLASSLALHAALSFLVGWAGDLSQPHHSFIESAALLRLYREQVQASGSAIMAATGFRIADLDVALQRRLSPVYPASLDAVLHERMTKSCESGEFDTYASSAFLGAFSELVEALHELKLDYVPCQGTLISLLRYGTFPSGRLGSGKWDVVDNDAELMVILDEGQDAYAAGRQASLALEARGWPPCINPHHLKFVCFSLHWRVPIKIELYMFKKDLQQRTIFRDRTCSGSRDCTYDAAFPLQFWGGRMPMDIVYPFSRCRLGNSWRHATCPGNPLRMLKYWNSVSGLGEYERQSLVDPLSNQSEQAVLKKQGGEAAAQQDSNWCVALPVMSKDRDQGDSRNKILQKRGLEAEDLRLLRGYARGLHRRGFASFHAHLSELPCLARQQRILAGDQHVGLTA